MTGSWTSVTAWVQTAGLVAFWIMLAITTRRAMAAGRGDLVNMILLTAILWCCGWAGYCLAVRDWVGMGINAFWAVVYFRLWNRDRRGRDRAAKLIGDKMRAIRDKLVARQREATSPGRG